MLLLIAAITLITHLLMPPLNYSKYMYIASVTVTYGA